MLEDGEARIARLHERLAQELGRDAGDLDVHLQGGDALVGARDLEVHVAEVVLGALDVGQDDVVVALHDQAHRDAGDRRLDRHAGVHQRERRAAHRGHRRRAVGLEHLGDEAHRVRERLGRREDRHERALGERTVTDVAALRAAHEAGLAHREGREVVVVHVALVVSSDRSSMRCSSLAVPSVASVRTCVWPRVNRPSRACAARTTTSQRIERISVARAAVGAALLDRDLLAHDRLVDRVGRPAAPTCWASGSSAASVREGNGSWSSSSMRANRAAFLAVLSSFESCSASGELRSAGPN